MAEEIKSSELYSIVDTYVYEGVDKKEYTILPCGTENQVKLAAWYSVLDLVIDTYNEERFGELYLTNLALRLVVEQILKTCKVNPKTLNIETLVSLVLIAGDRTTAEPPYLKQLNGLY